MKVTCSFGIAALTCAGLVGCAHAPPEPAQEPAAIHDRVVLATDTPPPPPEPEADPSNRPRPRLSQTVTLGQQTLEPYYEGQAPPAQGQGGTNVIVNNNIYVGQPGYGYGYYGGGYYPGGYGVHPGGAVVGGAVGRGGQNTPGTFGGTAASPGYTPHVGGNWAPAPSYGPRTPR
jgi:hypothetical protein